MKYLITGLGNIGLEYLETRHNAGFKILDFWAKEAGVSFKDKRYGFVCEIKFKSRIFVLVKPSTYVNLSGKAVNYWLSQEKVPLNNLLVVLDDISLPFGVIRLKPKGGDGGHNGLFNINQVLGTQNYARLRFGIGNDFYPGGQSNYVLSEWYEEEKKVLDKHFQYAVEIIKSFGTIGIEHTMNQFNNRKMEL